MNFSLRFLTLTALVLLPGTVEVEAFPTLFLNEPPAVTATRDVSSATLDGVTYVNKGLVGFGYIPSNFRESTGDTLGGFGSAIAIKRGTWQATKDGKFTGTLVVHPDRGYNIDQTINYQSRQHEISLVLTPYYGSANQTLAEGSQSLQLKYLKTTLQYDRWHKTTSGLDPNAVRQAQLGSKTIAFLDPEMPIVAKSDNRISLDVEGLVMNRDGSFWISDEYGPYIYRFSADGNLLQTIQPPDAILPGDATGALNFTSAVNPATGRGPNQGLENLTVDESTSTLYAMLQSATIQDGGSSKATSRYTRLLAYDINPLISSIITPQLKGEWVVPLPLNAKGNTLACSEIHFVSKNIFLALSRDGDGKGGDDTNSKYKQADLFSISKATDIHGSKFDSASNPVAVNGTLDSSITPAEYVPFISYIDPIQLARFGLHNGKPNDQTLIDSKWESFALAPVGEKDFPNDYFLITAADNDFISTNGVSLGVPFNAGQDVDNQVLIWRVTLPSVKKGSVEGAIGI